MPNTRKSARHITIRMGAATNSIDVDGTRIDRSSLTKGEDRKVRGIIVGALTKDGYFNKHKDSTV
jgi:hypothetical protein